MKALKKIKVAEKSILSSHQMNSVRGGSGSGAYSFSCVCANGETKTISMDSLVDFDEKVSKACKGGSASCDPC